jgi:hypothetical protein
MTRDQEYRETQGIERTAELERKKRFEKEVIEAADGQERDQRRRSEVPRQGMHDQKKQKAKTSCGEAQMQTECEKREQSDSERSDGAPLKGSPPPLRVIAPHYSPPGPTTETQRRTFSHQLDSGPEAIKKA